MGTSFVPNPPPQLSSLVVRITRTASDDSCGGGLGMRLSGYKANVLHALDVLVFTQYLAGV